MPRRTVAKVDPMDDPLSHRESCLPPPRHCHRKKVSPYTGWNPLVYQILCLVGDIWLIDESDLTWSSPNSPSHIVLMLVVMQQIWSQFWISELKRWESRAGRRISKFCRRKECQFRLEARRIIQLFHVGLPRFSCQIIIFCQIMIGNKSYWRRRLSQRKKDSSSAHLLLMAVHFIQPVFQRIINIFKTW